jgi:hypothetical protein
MDLPPEWLLEDIAARFVRMAPSAPQDQASQLAMHGTFTNFQREKRMSAARFFATAIAIGLFVAVPATAQDKGKDKGKERLAVTKVLLENDKVRVTESTFLPGDVSRGPRKDRTNYIVTDGKLERTTKDGKKSTYERKKGTAMWLPADDDVVRNVGKTTYVVIGVTNK